MKTILVCAAWLGAVAVSAMAGGEKSAEKKPLANDRTQAGENTAEPQKDFEGKRHRHHHGRRRGGHHPRGVEGMFKSMDTNEDGLISKEEFFAAPRIAKLSEEKREKLFARFDRNGDGSISKQEMHELRKESREQREREFRELDLNNSGGLDFEEFSKGKFFQRLPEEKRREIFERMDTNKDGEISPEDRPHRGGKKRRRG